MRRLPNSISLPVFTALASLAGCAGPQFQTTFRYEAPADIQGKACVQSCDQNRQACQLRFQACQTSIEPMLEERYRQALKQYEQDLGAYAQALQDYRVQVWMGLSYGPWPYYRGYYFPWPGPYYPPPSPVPSMPTREDVRAVLEKEKCQADCGCLSDYDACFVNCGGKRIPQTVCARNCPKQY